MAVSAKIENGNLVITLPLTTPPTLSKNGTGKNMVVASSHGNQVTELKVEGQPVVVGVNAYYRPAK